MTRLTILTADAPIRLLTGPNAEPIVDPAVRFWTLLLIFAGLAVVSCVVALVLARRRWLVRRPGHWATLVLTRRAGLSARERRLIERIAHGQGVLCAGLLVSPDALRRAIDAQCAHAEDAADRSALDQLARTLLAS